MMPKIEQEDLDEDMDGGNPNPTDDYSALSNKYDSLALFPQSQSQTVHVNGDSPTTKKMQTL